MEYMRNITVIFSCYPSPAPALPAPTGSLSDEISGHPSSLPFNILGSNSCQYVFALSVATYLFVQVGFRSLKILAEWPPPLPEIQFIILNLSLYRKVSMEWPPPLPAIVYIFVGSHAVPSNARCDSNSDISNETLWCTVITYCPVASCEVLLKRNSLRVGGVASMNHLILG
jgi:hypothetical protein